MRGTFWGLRGLAVLIVVGLMFSELPAASEKQRLIIEELQRQHRQVLEQQQRQFEDQQHQRRIDEINRIGEESRRSPYHRFLDQQIIEMLSPPSRR